MKLLLLLLCACFVPILAAVLLIALLVHRAGRRNRARRRVMRLGEPAVAWATSCTFGLTEKPADGWAIALISPDPKVSLADLARLMKSINDYPSDGENSDFVDAWYDAAPAGRSYEEGFRSRIPDSVTGGREIYAVHIWVFQSDVPGQRLTSHNDFPLPCQINWDEEGSFICTRPDGWQEVIEEGPPAVPCAPLAPRLQGAFAARFLTVRPVPFVREVMVRVACAIDPDVQRRPWVVAEATRNLQIAVQDPGHPHSAEAQQLFHMQANEPPVRLPEAFAPREEIWLFGARLMVDDLPGDTRDNWSVPEDLYCSIVRLDGNKGVLTFAQKPADSVLNRQRQRVQAAERHGGVPVFAVIVQANTSLFHPGEDNQPATVVYSPDPAIGVDGLRRLADQIATLKGKRQTDSDLAILSEYVTNETACPFRRRLIPGRFVRGKEVYIADLSIYRAFLPSGVLKGRDALLCVAEPGSEGGALELLPENLRSREIYGKPAAEVLAGLRSSEKP